MPPFWLAASTSQATAACASTKPELGSGDPLEVERDLLSVTVTRELYRVDEDPGEYIDLAQKHPDVVQSMDERIYDWRSPHPVGGIHGRIAAPPGWHPPRDWTTYPRPLTALQDRPASHMAPSRIIEHTLDYLHGARGRVKGAVDAFM